MLWASLSSKQLGFYLLTTKAVISATIPQKQPPVGPWQLKIAEICNALVGLCFIYALETRCEML